MTDQEINQAIAEWEFKRSDIPSWKLEEFANRRNYVEDLNACHEAENRLEPGNAVDGLVAYGNKLMRICGSHADCIHATARQRCEALLRVLGKWKE